MISKAEIIRRHLAGKSVLDLGGAGYGETNAYERELAAAWSACRRRVRLDRAPSADIVADLDARPLPRLEEAFEVAAAFDVLEHLKQPVEVLRWIPCARLIVTLPNALSWAARRMEERQRFRHLYSFTAYTATVLMEEGGWRVTRREYQFGTWSLRARVLNRIGSLAPSRAGTGIVLYCERSAAAPRRTDAG